MITVLEVDTESRAWHLKADNKEAAIKSLAEMSEELKGIESFFVNGEDVTSYVFSQKENLNEKKESTPIFELPEIKPASNIENIVLPSIEEIKKAGEFSQKNNFKHDKPVKLSMPETLPVLKCKKERKILKSLTECS